MTESNVLTATSIPAKGEAQSYNSAKTTVMVAAGVADKINIMDKVSGSIRENIERIFKSPQTMIGNRNNLNNRNGYKYLFFKASLGFISASRVPTIIIEIGATELFSTVIAS